MPLQTLNPASPDTVADQPPPADLTFATRYLSAGAYLNPTFRDRCLREVYYQARRFTAPSYGFDLVTVLEHCLRARNLTMWRDGSIVLVLAVGAYLNWISAASVAVVLVCLRVTNTGWRLIRDFLARVRTGSAVDTTRSPSRGLRLLLRWAAAWIAFILLVENALSATTAAGSAGLRSVTALLVAPSALLLPVLFALWRQKRIEDFTMYGGPPQIRWNERKRVISQQQTGNTIVYSNFEPFIGAGDVVSNWGFAQRLVRKQPAGPAGTFGEPTEGEREFEEPPFSAEQIVGYVRHHLRKLSSKALPEMSIPDLTIQDRIFQSAREDGPRTTFTAPEEMAEIIRNPTNPARHYLACQVVSWGGDVVTTVYVHIAVQGRSLYLEVTSTTLAPCNERYRLVDSDGGTGARAWLRAAVDGARHTPRTIVHAPGNLIRAMIDMSGYGSRTRRGTSRRRRDYGALVSVREMGTRDKLRNFTQRQDILKFRRLIESRVFSHVLDFLDERDVDTSEVRAQRATILYNSGILVGGDMSVREGSVSNQTSE
ncbi:hypothetical protein GA0070216_13520 [Micromonospora matsumotoense]|uniref:Uncharacterized protein n=1 Tax=Micromonospora matsumotoense TaxID=121616 RepID=A0A1C5AWB1_9ACTN|nr:hypothetical protein [Micromonospora matsumotoense]SCF49515.1 hypothetical protein GA0070216_13520 [Micromonospora matsumotoense]